MFKVIGYTLLGAVALPIAAVLVLPAIICGGLYQIGQCVAELARERGWF